MMGHRREGDLLFCCVALKNVTYGLQKLQCKDGVLPNKSCVNLSKTYYACL